jgi:predicted dehydrogenase
MAKKKRIGVGIIGCGNISNAYFNGAKAFEVLEVVSCTDIKMTAARAKAKEHGCQAQTVKALLANKAVDLVINLTIPASHAEVSMAALRAGKHVHCEKPLAVELDDGKAVLDLADKKRLLVGCAPDTFMGAGYQTCRKVVDDGWIGRVTSGTAFMMGRGPEGWHPNPGFFYQRGGGPMFDMGPYYLTALVHLLGPVARVAAITSQAFEERMATSEALFGKKLPVEVPTHYAGALEFHSGATITATFSFDVPRHQHHPIELYGTHGSLRAPDPNGFGGPVEVYTPTSGDWQQQALSHPYETNMRGIGAADMAYAILGKKRRHRTSGELAYHVLEIMHAFEKSSETRRHVKIKSKPVQPAALPLGLVPGRLDS